LVIAVMVIAVAATREVR